MKQKTSIFFIFASFSFYLSQTGVGGYNIPELFTALNSTVYIPCYVDTGTDHEHMTPISWTRVGYDGFVQTMMAQDFVSPSNVGSFESKLSSFPSLVVSNMVNTLSGTYTCHTDKGSASTLVHVLDGGTITKPSCSENFELVHGRCLYYSNIKKIWIHAQNDCEDRTSSLITFKDVKDLVSFMLNLQKSGSTHYQFPMYTGHASYDERHTSFGSLQNDAQVSPMLHKGWARVSTCGYLTTLKRGVIHPLRAAQCGSYKYNFLCEQPTL